MDFFKIMFGGLFTLKLLGKTTASWAVVLAPWVIFVTLHFIVMVSVKSAEMDEDDIMEEFKDDSESK